MEIGDWNAWIDRGIFFRLGRKNWNVYFFILSAFLERGDTVKDATVRTLAIYHDVAGAAVL